MRVKGSKFIFKVNFDVLIPKMMFTTQASLRKELWRVVQVLAYLFTLYTKNVKIKYLHILKYQLNSCKILTRMSNFWFLYSHSFLRYQIIFTKMHLRLYTAVSIQFQSAIFQLPSSFQGRKIAHFAPFINIFLYLWFAN